MRALLLQISDVAAVTGYTRFQLHGLLRDLFPVPTRGGKKTRSQRTFSRQEIIAIAAACEIEMKYGVKRQALAPVCDKLRDTLNGPRKPSREARLVVTFTPPSATYLESETAVAEGLVVPLGPLFAKVDDYLGVADSSLDGGQANLPLSPAIVTNRRSGGARNR